MRRPLKTRPQHAKTLALGALMLLTACSFVRRPGPMPDRSADPRIVQAVQQRLAAEPALRGAQIRVEVDGGVVMLYGSVEGMGRWNCALRNASLVRGVESVVDYLIIERGPREVQCEAPRPAS